MRFGFFPALLLAFLSLGAHGQQDHSGASSQNPEVVQPDASQDGRKNSQLPNAPAAAAKPPLSQQQPKRILGVMPNYRAVSAGEIPPPPGPKQAFVLATQNSFDYSSFVFVGLTSMIAEGEDAHPQLGKGVHGFWGYSWRGFVDKADGNYLVIWALPTITHEDERYFAKGQGSIMGRGIYAASRVLITPNYSRHNTLNISELAGRGIAEAVSTTYYPSSDRTAAEVSEKLAWSLGRDALTNVFREFWPDIATHVLHRHP